MRQRKRDGFTLVEIMVVVVILGTLAAVVTPQFAGVSQEAVKGGLKSQLSVVAKQLELYRMRNEGALPPLGIAAGTRGTRLNTGWDVLVSQQYLPRPPVNTYTKQWDLAFLPGTAPNIAPGELTTLGITVNGWGFRIQDWSQSPPLDTQIFAVGYDPVNDLLSNEVGYQQAIP